MRTKQNKQNFNKHYLLHGIWYSIQMWPVGCTLHMTTLKSNMVFKKIVIFKMVVIVHGILWSLVEITWYKNIWQNKNFLAFSILLQSCGDHMAKDEQNCCVKVVPWKRVSVQLKMNMQIMWTDHMQVYLG